ncbi:unnamed protein product [Bemisia tabaci]|uniref:AAA-ATPase-like domain-containing protein n=1 Tax=Bemisia tabaci TaxID=7038 RepID=A0A9P0A3H8_BEMTA|nr:unnamed protein product [Bemisia tabaci]CAH0762819.1 unnamed protein product [Bemisia tabaci]
MLYYFLTVNGRYSQLFQNLTIAKDRHFCRMHQNKHPTMSVRFGYNYWITYEQAIDGMRQVMHKLFLRNKYVMKSVNITEPEKRKFEVILNKNGTHDETIDAIRLMTDLMSRYHHSRVILLVDAYDTSINRAFFHGFYSQMVNLMRSALQRAMERNPFLLKAVVMGTTLVSYHGLFLGINFVEIHSVWSPKYQYCFGFTEEEVKKVLLDHNYNERALDNMREFYEGYYIGNKKMFNPYSVMNSLHRDGQTIAIKNLWVKSADPMDFIDLMLRHGILPILNAEILLSGQDIYKVVTAAIELPKIKDDEMTFWSYLTQTGYLAISTQTRRSTGEALRVPNREVALAFRNAVAAYYKHFNTTPQYEDFRGSLRDRNSTAIKVCLEEYVNKSTPFFHGRNLADFEGLMTGILRGVERDHGAVTKHREGDHTSTLTLGPSGNSTEKLVFVLTEAKAKEKATDAKVGVKKMFLKFCRMFQGNETILSLSMCDGLFELRLDVK